MKITLSDLKTRLSKGDYSILMGFTIKEIVALRDNCIKVDDTEYELEEGQLTRLFNKTIKGEKIVSLLVTKMTP